MQAHKIVVREMQRNCRLQVFKFLAESICEASKAPHAHPHGQVLTLNHTGRDVGMIGGSSDHCARRACHARRGIAAGTDRLGVVKFNYLPVVHIRAESGSEAWPGVLSKIVRAAYVALFKINLEAASPGQFLELFRSTYPGTEDVSRKSQTFFLNAAREAGIKISPYIMKNKKPRTTPNKKRAPKADKQVHRTGNNDGGGRIGHIEHDPPTSKLPSEILLGLFDPSNMEKTEQDAIWTLIKHYKGKGK